MAKAVGLDIGARSIKIAELEGSAKKYRITRFACRDVPSAAADAESDPLLETLATMLKEHKLGRDTVVTSVAASGITIREILVPFQNEEQIRKVVKFEAETHLHAIAIEDVIVDYVPIGETKDGTRLVVFAVPKQHLRERLRVLKQVDVDPRAIDLDIVALYNAAFAAGVVDEERNVVIADIGAASTKLLYVRRGEIRSVRSLRMGTDSVARQLGSDLKVTIEEAIEKALPDRPDPDRILVPAGEIESDVPETAKSATQLEKDLAGDHRRGFLDRVSRELTRSLGASTGASGVDAFYVTGGGSRSPEVVEALSKRFGVPVTPLDLLEKLPHSLLEDSPDEVNARGAVAIGLALKQFGQEAVRVDFRQEEFAFARKFEILKLSVGVGVAFVFILVFLYFLHLQRSVSVMENQYGDIYVEYAADIHADALERYGRVVPERDAANHDPRPAPELARVRAYQRALLGLKDELVNELGINPDIPPIRSSLGVLREFVERIRRARETQIEYLRIDRVIVTKKSVQVEGVIDTADNIGKLRALFGVNKDDIFREAVTKNIQAVEGSYTNLDLEILLREENS